MKLPRRKFLHLAAGTAAISALPRYAPALAYPTRSVHIILGFPAGNASDIIARLMAQSLSERLSQQCIVENRPGASSNIATEAVVRAPADGYTLLMEVVTSNAINAALYANLKFNFINDIAPVASIGEGSYVLVVHPSVPAKTIPDFIAYAKANPGKLSYASSGGGGATHVFGELFKITVGVDLFHVPYRGSFTADLLTGQVQVVFGPISQLIEHIRTEKLRALAVTSATRQAALPDVPTMAEYVQGYEASVWYGIGAPKNTPVEIIEKLNMTINAALGDARMKARLGELSCTPIPMTSTEFGKFIAAETEKWAKVIRAANIKAD